LKEPALAQLDKCCVSDLQHCVPGRNPLIGHVIIGNSKSLCDEIKIADRVTLCEASNKKLLVRI
jgi:hypothetical protein